MGNGPESQECITSLQAIRAFLQANGPELSAKESVLSTGAEQRPLCHLKRWHQEHFASAKGKGRAAE